MFTFNWANPIIKELSWKKWVYFSLQPLSIGCPFYRWTGFYNFSVSFSFSFFPYLVSSSMLSGLQLIEKEKESKWDTDKYRFLWTSTQRIVKIGRKAFYVHCFCTAYCIQCTYCRVEWFWKNLLTHSMLCQIVVGSQIQNFMS